MTSAKCSKEKLLKLKKMLWLWSYFNNSHLKLHNQFHFHCRIGRLLVVMLWEIACQCQPLNPIFVHGLIENRTWLLCNRVLLRSCTLLWPWKITLSHFHISYQKLGNQLTKNANFLRLKICRICPNFFFLWRILN